MTNMPCAACGGRGFNTCTACGGAGGTMISKSRMRLDRTIEYYQDRVPCTGCFGSGRIMCAVCGGTGAVLQSSAPQQVSQRKRQPPAPPRESHTPREFAFQVQDFVRHPQHDEIWACWQHNPGNCLDIGLSVNSSMRLELNGCQTDVWLDIRDNSGRPVPLAIRMEPNGQLMGKWL